MFDGWGYVRLFRTDIPRHPGQPGSITQIDPFYRDFGLYVFQYTP